MPSLTLSPSTDATRSAFARIAAHAFAFPVEDAPDWFARAGHDNVRVLRDGGRVIGGLITIPMGQWFGGRAVSMTGLAGVAITPEARGGGAASFMLRDFLRELRSNGVALSTLYPANVPLYQKSGWERAGARFEIRVAPTAAHTHERGLVVTPVTSEEDAEVRALATRWAAQRSGVLQRGPYCWGRVFRPRKATTEAFKVTSDAGLEGYVVLSHAPGQTAVATQVTVHDMAATTRRAADRVLRLLFEYGSVASTVRWWGGAPDLFTFALGDRRHDIAVADYWMTRIVDLPRALASRGYPPSVSTELDLEVEDDVLPENAGRFRLVVRDGRAEVARGGEGSLRLHARALSPLYTGFLGPRVLAAAGALHGDDATLARAESIFAGPAPAMSDMF